MEKLSAGPHDALAGMTVTEGIHGTGHGVVDRRVCEQARDFTKDGASRGADQTGRARLHRLGPLRRVPQYQHGFSQGGGLLLKPPESVSTRVQPAMAPTRAL